MRKKIPYILFRRIDERTDKGDLFPVEICNRRKRAEPSLVKQVQHKGLDGIVVMMTECYLVAARLDRGIMEYPAPHLGTERAGVRLLSCLENYLSDES